MFLTYKKVILAKNLKNGSQGMKTQMEGRFQVFKLCEAYNFLPEGGKMVSIAMA